jgi:hypothetical protein
MCWTCDQEPTGLVPFTSSRGPVSFVAAEIHGDLRSVASAAADRIATYKLRAILISDEM